MSPASPPKPFRLAATEPSATDPRRWLWLLCPLAAAAIVAGWFVAGTDGLPLDDAYIHLTFARNLAAGDGFAFNPGQPSLGFSSPLWVMLLALQGRAGLDPPVAARGLGLLAFAAVSVLLFLVVEASLAPKAKRSALVFALAAGAGLPLSGNMLWLAGSGMEAMLYLCFGLLAILLLRPRACRPIVGGLALALLILTRATGLMLALILLSSLGLERRRRQLLTAGVVAAALSLPWFLYSRLAAGFWLPPTRAGKLASNLVNAGFSPRGIETFLGRHLVYFWQADRGLLLLALIALAAAAIGTASWYSSRTAAGASPSTTGLLLFPLPPALTLGLWALADLAMHSLLFRSTAATTPVHYLRYEVMLIPAIVAVAAFLLGTMAARVRPGWKAAVPLLLLLAPLALEGSSIPAWRALYRRGVDQLQHEHLAAARWARDRLPAGARIACFDIGILGYYSGREVVDLGGLTDPGVLPYLAVQRTGPYLLKKGATHYFAMVRHDSERLTGVKADDGRLYHLQWLQSFQYPSYPTPVLLHSLGIEVYKINPL